MVVVLSPDFAWPWGNLKEKKNHAQFTPDQINQTLFEWDLCISIFEKLLRRFKCVY